MAPTGLSRWWRRLREKDNPAQAVGRRGERLATVFLKRQGYRILARNLRNRFGEIDIVAQVPDEQTIAIVEVKSGRGGALLPELHVNNAKQRKLVALGAQLARTYRLEQRPLRFDVIGVDLPEHDPPTIRHHVGAFGSHV